MLMFAVSKSIQNGKAGAELSQQTLQGFQNKKYGDKNE